jgi:hypothetical protein
VLRQARAPGPKRFRIPKRLARIRRHVETKRLDNLKKFHEALVETSKQEQEFVKDLFMRRSEAWKEATADDLDDIDAVDDEE